MRGENIFYVYWLTWYAAHLSINHIKAFQNFIFHLTLTDNVNRRTIRCTGHCAAITIIVFKTLNCLYCFYNVV